VQTVERMAFDGFTLLCWKKDGAEAVLGACPAAQLLDYQHRADTDLGKNQQLCQHTGVSAECIDHANSNDRNPSIDEFGVTEDPWA
jgi:hypothetical protein